MKNTLIACAGLAGILALAPLHAQSNRNNRSDRTERPEKPAPAETKKNPPPKFKLDPAPLTRQAPNSYAPVIKKAAPSVVSVFSSRTVQEPDFRNHPLLNDPLFRRFFGPQIPDQEQVDPESDEPQAPPQRRNNRRGPRSHQEMGLGSGVIVTEDGYIITNNHVIEGADEIKVETANGTRYVAKLIGADAPSDIAVLKIDGQGLPAITMGTSENLEVGDVVLAIGNPFGIGQTVTMGIISGINRALRITQYDDLIQTDAAINVGNSGGALVDAQGRLIGVNTAILSRTGGNVGVGFAVPINMARNITEGLTRSGKVLRGFLGIQLQEVTPELAKQFNLPEDTTGAVVADFYTKNSPASAAGIKLGDVITEFNGVKIRDYSHLRLLVSQTAPHTDSTVKAYRDGKLMTFKLKLGELPSDTVASGGGNEDSEDSLDKEALEGVTVSDIDAESRRQFRIPEEVKGALVTDVDPDSKAYQEGLRPGHVILEMDRKPVNSAEEAVKLSENPKGDSVLLRVWTQGNRRFLTVENGRNEPKNSNNSERPQQRQRQRQRPTE